MNNMDKNVQDLGYATLGCKVVNILKKVILQWWQQSLCCGKFYPQIHFFGIKHCLVIGIG